MKYMSVDVARVLVHGSGTNLAHQKCVSSGSSATRGQPGAGCEIGRESV